MLAMDSGIVYENTKQKPEEQLNIRFKKEENFAERWTHVRPSWSSISRELRFLPFPDALFGLYTLHLQVEKEDRQNPA